MMTYNDLESEQKAHVNGVLAKFMDAYIRTHLIWTPEQMYVDFLKKIKAQHSQGDYGKCEIQGAKLIYLYKKGNLWLETEDAKFYIMDKFTKKYRKNKKLARKDSPLIERARFGLRKDKERFFDINYGLKNGSDFQKTENVENLTVYPWSIEHVENELSEKYGLELREVFEKLSLSPIEQIFYNRWFERFYADKKNPAMLPEFCGARNMYYCYEKNGKYFIEPTEGSRPINVRFDFAVLNYTKQKMLFIELDGHDYHSSKKQRINDSVKRAIATQNGWQLNVITGTQIHGDVDGVFDMMEEYFLADE